MASIKASLWIIGKEQFGQLLIQGLFKVIGQILANLIQNGVQIVTGRTRNVRIASRTNKTSLGDSNLCVEGIGRILTNLGNIEFVDSPSALDLVDIAATKPNTIR